MLNPNVPFPGHRALRCAIEGGRPVRVPQPAAVRRTAGLCGAGSVRECLTGMHVDAMSSAETDLRDSGLYREVEAYFKSIHAPGEGVVTDAADVCVEPNGRRAAVTATIYDSLDAPPTTRLCVVDLRDGATT